MKAKLLALAVLVTGMLLRPHADASAAPFGEQCVATPPLVVGGQEILPAQQRCVPTP